MGCSRRLHSSLLSGSAAGEFFNLPALRNASRNTYSICEFTLRNSSVAQPAMASSTSALMRSG